MKKICVIGLGYIGLPTSVMFANNGFQVHGVDVNDAVVNSLSKGEVHIIEPGLKDLLHSAIEKETFTVSKEAAEADIYIIAVPSPINEDKTANLRYVEEATKSIIPYISKGNLVILESTVPPRTVEDVVLPILKESGLSIGDDLFVSHSPERVIPGKVFTELVENDRIVGGINSVSSDMTVELYKTFVKGKIHITDATTAEMVKVIENTYRDINIAFANELAKISDQIGVNVWEAINFANFHPRVNIHLPGPGVGGHCIAVDPWFLVEKQPELAQMIHLARNTNDSMPAYTAERSKQILEENGIENGKVTVLGLAFKANIDDMRESPSMEVVKHLRKQNVKFTAYDPHASTLEFEEQTDSFDEAVSGADLLLILTDHQVFKDLNANQTAELVKTPMVFDTKNCIERSKWEQSGFNVFKLGDSKNI